MFFGNQNSSYEPIPPVDPHFLQGSLWSSDRAIKVEAEEATKLNPASTSRELVEEKEKKQNRTLIPICCCIIFIIILLTSYMLFGQSERTESKPEINSAIATSQALPTPSPSELSKKTTTISKVLTNAPVATNSSEPSISTSSEPSIETTSLPTSAPLNPSAKPSSTSSSFPTVKTSPTPSVAKSQTPTASSTPPTTNPTAIKSQTPSELSSLPTVYPSVEASQTPTEGCFHDPDSLPNDGSVSLVTEYYLMPGGSADECPKGEEVPQDECLAAGLILGETQHNPDGVSNPHKLNTDDWNYTPCGCFFWTHFDEFRLIDFNTGSNPCAVDKKGSPICKCTKVVPATSASPTAYTSNAPSISSSMFPSEEILH